jgi:hypothetical protein
VRSAVVASCLAIAAVGCTAAHPSTRTLPAVRTGFAWRPAASCAAVAASRTTASRLPPPGESRLTTLLHIGGSMTLRPVSAAYRPKVSVATVWSRAQPDVERLARYQVFLARIWSPIGPTSPPLFHGQVYWVVLAEGEAGSPAYPEPSVASAPPAGCAFSGHYGFSILSATTAGKPFVEG